MLCARREAFIPLSSVGLDGSPGHIVGESHAVEKRGESVREVGELPVVAGEAQESHIRVGDLPAGTGHVGAPHAAADDPLISESPAEGVPAALILPEGEDHGVFANLGADAVQTTAGERVFGVSLNGKMVLTDFNIAREYGYARAVIKKFIVTVKDGKGITVGFHKQKGEPALNAIRIYKNW